MSDWKCLRFFFVEALRVATITMAPAAVIPATGYNDTVKTNFSRPIPSVPGKSLIAVEVSYPAGGASAPHHHSAFVYAYVVSGQIASQVDTEPAKLLAVFIADTGDNALTTPDQPGGSR